MTPHRPGLDQTYEEVRTVTNILHDQPPATGSCPTWCTAPSGHQTHSSDDWTMDMSLYPATAYDPDSGICGTGQITVPDSLTAGVEQPPGEEPYLWFGVLAADPTILVRRLTPAEALRFGQALIAQAMPLLAGQQHEPAGQPAPSAAAGRTGDR